MHQSGLGRTCAPITACVPHSCRPDRRAHVGQRVDHNAALAAQGSVSGRIGAAMPWNGGDLCMFIPTPPLSTPSGPMVLGASPSQKRESPALTAQMCGAVCCVTVPQHHVCRANLLHIPAFARRILTFCNGADTHTYLASPPRPMSYLLYTTAVVWSAQH